MKVGRILKSLILVMILYQTISAQVKDSLLNLAIKDLETNPVIKEDIYKFKGHYLPPFLLTSSNGIRINSDSLKGKPTVINFWFTECYPCIDEMPLLNELKNKFGEEVNFISITFNDASAVEKFLQKNSFNFTHIIDARSYINKFGFFGYPKTLILDKDLKIVTIEKKLPNASNKDKKVSVDVLQKFIDTLNLLK